MQFRKISFENKESWYACRGESATLDAYNLEEAYLFRKQKSAILLRINNRIIKICFGQSWAKDRFRKYTFNSQAFREYKSADFLREIGLSAPQSYFAAFSIDLLNAVDSIYEMSFLKNHEILGDFIRQRPDSTEIVSCIAEDLALMTNNMVCQKDFGLGNMMYEKDRGVSWIDNDLKKFKDKWEISVYLARQLKPRLLDLLSGQDQAIFWDIFCPRCRIHNEVIRALHHV